MLAHAYAYRCEQVGKWEWMTEYLRCCCDQNLRAKEIRLSSGNWTVRGPWSGHGQGQAAHSQQSRVRGMFYS